MGIWSWVKRLVTGESGPQTNPLSPAQNQPAWFDGNEDFKLRVVGEFHYQRTFEEICGPRTEAGENRIVTAVLILDNTNRYDNNAVRVEVEGKTVGHLGRSDASAFRTRLHNERVTAQTFTCKARIRGGWMRENRERGLYGINLDVRLY